MGQLIARMKTKGVRWYWLTRYWYMDTKNGQQWRIAGAVVFGLISLGNAYLAVFPAIAFFQAGG